MKEVIYFPPSYQGGGSIRLSVPDAAADALVGAGVAALPIVLPAAEPLATSAPTLRQVVRSGTGWPDYSSNNPNCATQNRSYHVMGDDAGAIQVEFPNIYVGPQGQEYSTTGTMDVVASIEYPAGTTTPLRFGGAAKGTIAVAGKLLSDPAPVAIPKGAGFWVRSNCLGSVNGLWSNDLDTARGEAFEFSGAALPDKTMGGAIAHSGQAFLYRPSAIVALSRLAAVAGIGDSRAYGTGDAYNDASGNRGELSRSIGAALPYLNAATPSAQLYHWTQAAGGASAGTMRLDTINRYTTDVVVQLGINDLRGNATAETVRAQLATLKSRIAAPRVWLTTIAPQASSTDGFATVANQTAQLPERVRHNRWVRDGATAAGFAGYFEIADVLESARDSGVWKAPPKLTTDGLHANEAGYALIVTAGAIPPGRFA